MDMTGEFTTNNAEPFRVTWHEDKAYRLERVSDLPGVLRVPVKDAELFAVDSASEKVNPLAKTTIVLGEPGSGMAAFKQWLLKQSGSFRLTDTVAETRRLIEKMTDKNPQHILLDLASRPLPSTPSTADQDELMWLAGALEKPNWTNLKYKSRIVVLTRNVDQLRSNHLFSYIVARGQTMRVPHFSPTETECWIQALHDKLAVSHKPLSAEIKREGKIELAKLARRWTGGQPLLMHYFFTVVERDLVAGSGAIRQVFDEAGEYLRDHQPRVVSFWLKQLEALISVRATFRSTLKYYMPGRTKNPQRASHFNDDDVDLFLAGWVGINHDGQWGIRSECHAAWAQLVR